MTSGDGAAESDAADAGPAFTPRCHLPPARVARIEDAALAASAPAQQLWLDGWLLRTSPGKARRARCVHALACGQRPFDDRVAECAARFAAAGLPMLFRMTPTSVPTALDAELAARGFTVEAPTWVMARGGGAAAPPAPADTTPAGHRWREPVPVDFAGIVGALRGSPAMETAAHAERLASADLRARRLVLEAQADGTPVAAGQIVFDGLTGTPLAGLYDVVTAASQRGHGLGRALCERLLSLAAHDGVTDTYLQVDADNTAARHLYRRLGFVDAYTYHYRRQAGAA